MSFGKLGALGRGFGHLGAGGQAGAPRNTLRARAGTFILTGTDMTPKSAYVAPAALGTFALTGIDATLTSTAASGPLLGDNQAVFAANVSSHIITVTTTTANELIVVLFSGAADVSTVADNHTLTWTRRVAVNRFSSQFMNEYSAVAATAQSYTITVTLTGSSSGNSAVVAFTVKGANSSVPYDVNAALPYLVGNSAGANGPGIEASITTTATNTFAYCGYQYGSTPTPAGGSGWTVLYNASSLGFLVEYKAFAAAQSGTAGAQGSSAGDILVGLADAVKP